MQICSYCHTGKVEERKILYVQWHPNENTVLIDRIPATVCNICGEKSYEPRALENLQRLLWAVKDNKTIARPARANNT